MKCDLRVCSLQLCFFSIRRSSMKMRLGFVVAAMVAMSTVTTANLYGAGWDAGNGGGAGGNLWSQGLNWDTDAVPASGDKAYLRDTTASADDTAQIASGTAAVADKVVIGQGALGKLIIQDGGSLTTPLIELGTSGGDGRLTFSYGSTASWTSDFRIGDEAGTFGQGHARGNNASPTTLTGGGMLVGNQGVGDFTQEGATITVNGSFVVGQSNTGTYDLKERVAGGPEPSVLTTTSRVKIGDDGNGTFDQGQNTTWNHTSFRLFIIGESSGEGTYNLAGGTLNITDPAADINVPRYGTGTLNQTGGDINTVASVVVAYGGTGTYNMNGGTLTAVDLSKGGGEGTFNFTDGEIVLDGNRVGFDAANAWFNVTGNTSLYQEEFLTGSNQTRLHYIPEPSSILMILAGAGLLLLRRR